MIEAIAKTHIQHTFARRTTLVQPGDQIELDAEEYLRLLRSGAVESAQVAQIRAEADEKVRAAMAEAEREAEAAAGLIGEQANADADAARAEALAKANAEREERKEALKEQRQKGRRTGKAPDPMRQ